MQPSRGSGRSEDLSAGAGRIVRRLLEASASDGEAGGHFTHPNAVIALTSDLTTADVGTTYIDDAPAAPRGRRDWIGRYGGRMLALLLLVCLLSAIQLVTLLGLRSAKRPS